MTTRSFTWNCCKNLVPLPVTDLDPADKDTVPAVWKVDERLQAYSCCPSYSQYNPFWSSNIPVLITAPVQLVTAILGCELNVAPPVVVAGAGEFGSTVNPLEDLIDFTV